MKKKQNTDFDRRDFLTKAVSLGVLGFAGNASSSLGRPGSYTGQTPENSPLRKGNYLIKGAYLITMDPEHGEMENHDIHIKGGKIASIGKNLSTTDAEVISGKDKIIMPGMIDTHWHMWTALLKSMATSKPGKGYFETTSGLGPHFSPNDFYLGTLLAGIEAVNSGITTVHDWSHNVRSLNHAEAGIKALVECGLRARYSCGSASGQDAEEPMDFDIIHNLKANWKNLSGTSDLMHLGFAWRGLGGHPGIDSKTKIGLWELEQARNMDLPISVHASAGEVMEKLVKSGVLAPDIQLVHGMDASTSQLEAMVAAGSPISISPYSELRIGYGFPPLDKMLEAGAEIGLSVDTTTLSGNADMFAIMKVFLNIVTAQTRDEFSISAKRVMEMATIEGARTLGIEDQTGSLTVGKKADIIMISTHSPNMGIVHSPIDLIVEAAQPSNIDAVWIDGILRKKDGKLIGVDESSIYNEAKEALNKLIKKAENA
ncbi:amidohydrolase family protein [Arthrospiribacter ruber]|uniref:Amidohydrolase-related domain-containing protein n=1 Tax=Arthrospiribacter ruber TaxID=2487934 RepID=A0A951ME69_9BACT|nr:amidohydrolase family protein [Arthrospiribacter ruber]MBW3469494.1 hypothetical protein [Arthrospiribacter ruber]